MRPGSGAVRENQFFVVIVVVLFLNMLHHC